MSGHQEEKKRAAPNTVLPKGGAELVIQAFLTSRSFTSVETFSTLHPHPSATPLVRRHFIKQTNIHWQTAD